MPIQIGQKKQVPIYEESTTTVTTVLNSANISSFFTVTNGSGTSGWTISNNSSSGLKLVPGNIGVNSTTATVTFVAKTNLTNVNISGAYYTESRYDKITLTVAGTTVLNGVSGTSSNTSRWSGSLASGKSIVLKYVKDSSQHATNESNTYFTITCDNIIDTITTSEIVGYEEKLLPQTISNLYLSPTKRVTNGWIKTSSGAKQFYSSLKTNSISYSGNYTQSVITIDGVAYDLFELTTSGNLTANVDEIWMCGGGGCGASGFNVYTSGGGGGGGYLKTYSGPFNFLLYSVTIGAGCNPTGDRGGSTRIEDLTGNVSYAAAGGYKGNSYDGGNGGSGGGAGASSNSFGNIGRGEGISTYPFGVTSLKAHCAGGGGGGTIFLNGEDGGTNGSNGSNGETGAGGEYGGGKGGVYSSSSSNAKGSPGTFYGAGGGGGSYDGKNKQPGGAGYQGVVYLLIKK